MEAPFEKCVCGCETGTPSHSPTSLGNRSGTAHTARLGGPGAVEGLDAAGAEGGLAEVEFPTDLFRGQRSSGESPPHQTPGPSSGIKSEITSFSTRQEAGSPQSALRSSTPSFRLFQKVGQLWNAASPRDLAAQKLGGAPRSPPSPGPPPHLHPPLHAQPPGRPQRSTGAPRGSSLPRAATPGGPTRPRLRGAPSPAWPPPGPSGRCSAGEGPRVTPPRGADTRRHPASRVSGGAHAGATQQDSDSLLEERWLCVWGSVGSGLGGGGSPATRRPRAAALVIVRAQRARRRGSRPFPLRSSSRCLTLGTLSGFRVREGGWGSPNPQSGPASWHKSGGRRLVGACPPPAACRRHARICGGGATWRSENTATPKLGGPYPSPQCCTPSGEPRPSSERGSLLPSLPSDSFAKR